MGELRRRGLYDSAMLDAFKGNDGAGKNTLPKSAHFAIYYPNLLIPVDDFDQMHFRGERFLFFFHSSGGSCWLHQLAFRLLPSRISLLSFSSLCIGYIAGYQQSRTLILWMRQIPLLRELPLALGTYFATENGFTPQEMAKMDVGAYLERKISERVSEPVRVCSCI